ncbi:MAG: transporter, partial [Candidatus Promineifilaceae bacterium]
MKSNKEKKRKKVEDLSGKDRIVKNVFTSWGSHLILIVIGFIMPRMINDHLGQVSLGIWDLSWSFVNYLTLAGFGVGSSVNRYVAKYRSLNDYVSLNKALSSVVFIQFLIALSVALGTGALVWMLPSLISGHEEVN